VTRERKLTARKKWVRKITQTIGMIWKEGVWKERSMIKKMLEKETRA
jgi:hypothetical protein